MTPPEEDLNLFAVSALNDPTRRAIIEFIAQEPGTGCSGSDFGVPGIAGTSPNNTRPPQKRGEKPMKKKLQPPDIVIVGSVNLDIGFIQEVSLGHCDSQTPHGHEPETVFAETQL